MVALCCEHRGTTAATTNPVSFLQGLRKGWAHLYVFFSSASSSGVLLICGRLWKSSIQVAQQ